MFGAGFGAQQPAFGAAQPATAAFGQTSFGAFGQQPQQQQQQPAFGAAPTQGFGAAAPAFGASPAPAFGAAPAPAFGAAPAATPAFGAPATNAFGTPGAFGGPRPATGAFGAFGGTTNAFGAASQPAFGSSLGTSTFGAASTPAFGSTSTPSAFGAPAANAFGSTSQAPSPFGATAATQSTFGMPSSTGLFGAAAAPAATTFGAPAATPGFGAAGGFGAASPGATGTRIAPYQKTVERDGTSATGAASTANYITITAMPQYQNKSLEELRWEDYQAGIKSAASAPAPASAFGATTPGFGATTTGFGTPSPASTSAFGLGTTGAFGSTTPAPAFGSTPTTNAFGGGSLFGGQSAAAPTFGSTAPTFGAASTPNPFGGGAASTSAFGAPAATSAFGAANPFGSTPAPAFGAASTAPRPAAFSFNTPASTFGAASTPATGFGASAPSIFGASPASAPGGLFGSTAPNPFGTTATPATAANPFGQSAFGAKPATSAFGSQPSAFGASSTGAFGTNMFGQPGAGGGLFGSSAFPAASSPAPSMFGSSTPSLFGGATTGSLFGGQQSAFGGLGGGSAMQPFQSAAAAQPAAPPNVAVAPYGAFPSLPSVPEPKVGISSRPARTASGGGYGALSGRASPLVSLRATASGAHNKMGAVTGMTSRGVSPSPLGSLGVVAGDSGSGAMSLGTTPNGAITGTPGLLRPRPNPHQLFIREPPPSTHNAPISSAFSPARTPTETQRDTSPQHEGRNVSTANGGGGGGGVPYNPFPPASPPAREAARDTAADTAAADGGTAARKTTTAPTRNGAGPSSNGADGPAPSYSRRAREVEEEEDTSYLPQLGRLSHDDYSYEPSSRQLVAMHQSDPESLSHVSNFTVERKGVGSVRWLNPVDVRGLKMEDIVSIQHGEVACFTQGVKPPEGTGLNSEALITLWEVYKTDKEGNVIKDGPAVIKWEKQLRSMCGKMGSKFVSYKAAGGVWKFEVEHFSRYGLLPDADDDDEEEEEAPQRVSNGVSDALQDREVINLAEDERRGERATGAGASCLAGSLRQGSGPSGRMGMHRPGAKVQPSTPSAPLQHALPMHLALSSQKLRTMQDTFFTAEPEPVAQMRPTTDLVPAGTFTPAAGPSHAPAPTPVASSTTTQGGNLFPQVWRTPTPALRASRRPTVASASGMTDASMALATPSSSYVLSPPDGRAGAATEDMGCHHHMDAGLSLGLSFRPSWGPNGTLVIPGPPSLRMGSGAQPIMVRRVLVEGQGSGYGSDAGGDTMDEAEGPGVPPRLAALRAKLRALLQVHLRHSAPVGEEDEAEAGGSGARDDFLPQWRLQCSPHDLPSLVAQLVASAQSPGAELAAAGAALSPEEESAVALLAGDEDWQADVQHEVETWRLLKVLFEAEPPGAARTSGSGGDSGRSATLLEDDAMETGPEMARSDIASTGPAPPLTAALHRQSGFSRWLQQQVLPDVQTALLRLSGGPTSSCDAILELLSARHVAGAAAVAAAAGDVRLATLVACAGQRAAAQAQARQQLEVWQTTGMTGRIAPDRLLVYKLLAGQVSEVIHHLGLDWRRALGLYVWYLAVPGSLPPAAGMSSMGYGYETPGQPTGNGSSGMVPTARNQPGALATAASLYHQALQQHQPLPAPLPPHCRDLLPSSVPQNPPADLQYTLLQLWVQREQLAVQASDDAEDQPPLGLQTPPQLLAPSSHSSNPCATALPWALLTVLQSVEVLEHVGDRQLVVGAGYDADVAEQWEFTLAAHMALISQLLLAGELCEWAVYVALHLPDRPPVAGATAGRLRHAVVQHLLELTAPQWVGHDSREAFFTDALGIPQVLLSDAAAGWALARGDTAGAVQQYLAAEEWQAAHGLLAMQLAPLLVCQERVEELRELLVALEPHASSCMSWQYGGGMYLAYLEAVHASRTTSSHASSLAELQDLAAALCQAKDGAAAALSSNAELTVVEPGAQAAGGGVGGVLTRLAALELMSRRVQGLLMRALASELASGTAESGALDLPLMLGSFAGQASTRSTSMGAAVATLAAQLLAV